MSVLPPMPTLPPIVVVKTEKPDGATVVKTERPDDFEAPAAVKRERPEEPVVVRKRGRPARRGVIPRRVTVKQEKPEGPRPVQKQEPVPPPDAPVTPWAVRVVPVKPEPDEPRDSRPAETKDVKVVPARPPQAAPWTRPNYVPAPERDVFARTARLPDRPSEEEQEQERPRERKKHKKVYVHIDPANLPPAPDRKCMQNYVAVDPSREMFGLIDQGLADGATRSFVMHVRRGQTPWTVLGAIRPGVLLPVISKSGRGGVTNLRVRFTTPAQYYSPGSKVTSMRIGVDEADWQSLMTKAHRI